MGDNARNLSVECIDRWNEKLGNTDYRLYWEGNYYDSDVHDYAELTLGTLDVLVNKCAHVLKGAGAAPDAPVLLYLPAVIQLPIAAIAALRIGAPFLPFSAMNDSVEELSSVITASGVRVVVTVDGFWRGTTLIRTKYVLDEATQRCSNTIALKVLVIRHVSPNEGVPPPTREYVARRPHYKYTVNMQEGRDSWWSDHFPTARAHFPPVDCEQSHCALLQPILFSDGGSTEATIVEWSVKDLRGEICELLKEIGAEGLCFTMCAGSAVHEVLTTLAVLHAGSPLLIFEGIVDHPDFSRISQIVNEYKVERLVILEEHMRTLLDHEDYVRMWDTKCLQKVILLRGPSTPSLRSVSTQDVRRAFHDIHCSTCELSKYSRNQKWHSPTFSDSGE